MTVSVHRSLAELSYYTLLSASAEAPWGDNDFSGILTAIATVFLVLMALCLCCGWNHVDFLYVIPITAIFEKFYEDT